MAEIIGRKRRPRFLLRYIYGENESVIGTIYELA